MSCLEFLGCLSHFMKWLSTERNFLSKGVPVAPHPTPSTPFLSLLYIFQIDEYVCRRVNLEVFGPRGLRRKFGPTPKCAGTVVCACGVWCLCACARVCMHVRVRAHTPPPHTYTIHSVCISPPLLSLSVVSTLPLLSLSHVCTHSHSARREHMYLRNVKPLKSTVKAATPPTTSPKGFQEHMFWTYVSSEALMQWEGAGCNVGAQVPSEGLLFIFPGKGNGGCLFFLTLFLLDSFPSSLPPSLLSILPLMYPKGFTWFLLKNHVIVTKLWYWLKFVKGSGRRGPHQDGISESNVRSESGPLLQKYALCVGIFSVGLYRFC